MRTRRIGHLALLALESRRDHGDEPRREQHAGQHQRRGHQSQQRGHRACHPAGLRVVPAGAKSGVDRDERGREHAFAEQVLQEVGDPERGVERVGGVGGAEVVREDPVPDQPDDPAEEDPRSHHHRRSGGAAPGGGQDPEGGGRVERDEGSASSRWRKAFSSWRFCRPRFRSSTSASSSSTRLGQRRDVGRRLLGTFEPPRQRPPDRRVHHDAEDRDQQCHQQEERDDRHGSSLRRL